MLPFRKAQNKLPFQASDVQVEFVGNVRAVHVMPSGLVSAVAVPDIAMQKIDPFHITWFMVPPTGNVRAVHVMPSGLVKTVDVPDETATNKPLLLAAIVV